MASLAFLIGTGVRMLVSIRGCNENCNKVYYILLEIFCFIVCSMYLIIINYVSLK